MILATARLKLTKKIVDRASKDPERQVFLWDSRLPGFGVRIFPSGRRTYIYQYRTQTGQQRRDVLGVHGPMTTEKAREIAHDMYEAVRHGGDPVRDQQVAAESRSSNTIGALVPVFIERYMKRRGRAQSYIDDTQAIFDNHVLPHWRNRDIHTITRLDLNKLLDRVVEGGAPIAANRTLAAIRKMFNWALQRGVLENSPVMRFERPADEIPRERVLSADELRRLWPHLDAIGYPFGHLLKMALATGQRREEVAGMRWQDINEGERLWTIPSELTKARRVHAVPLSALAMQTLEQAKSAALERLGEDAHPTYVFTTLGDRPFSGYSKGKSRLDSAMSNAPIPAWTIHDLRRTVATGLARLGVSRFVVSRILNHADRSITGSVYDQYEYLNEKRTALDTWGRYVTELVAESTIIIPQAAE